MVFFEREWSIQMTGCTVMTGELPAVAVRMLSILCYICVARGFCIIYIDIILRVTMLQSCKIEQLE